jgi:hypothetical protein
MGASMKQVTCIIRILCGVLVGSFVSLGAVTSAHAVTYGWSFIGGDLASSGSGILETDVAIGPATVNSFDGTIGGHTITALLLPGSIGNNSNILYALSPGIELDVFGISFSADGSYYNIYYSTSASKEVLIGPIPSIGVFSVYELAETPIPAALPLFASGLGLMGLFGFRKKQKKAAV